MSMAIDMAVADQQANVRFLERMRESIVEVLSDGSMADGVPLGACLGMIEHAKSFKDVLCSKDSDVILPVRGPDDVRANLAMGNVVADLPRRTTYYRIRVVPPPLP
ncbi:unnamed protein product [Ectocarpus sp. 4 AP-2014]